MRWLPAALVVFAALASGCIGSPASVFHVGEDCSEDRQMVVTAQADMLMPATMPEDVRDSFGSRAKVTVHARDGQTVQGIATWAQAAGDVGLLFDGPRSAEFQTDQTWSGGGKVDEGNYTLELVGSPMAFEVTYTMYLIASGCTPIILDDE